MTRRFYLFDIETRCGLGLAMHAAMCADATFSPYQAPHEMALDTGLRPGVSVIHSFGLKMAADMARDLDVRAPRAVRERDWEQRLKKRRRR